jgi:hypothetical protein
MILAKQVGQQKFHVTTADAINQISRHPQRYIFKIVLERFIIPKKSKERKGQSAQAIHASEGDAQSN